MQESEISQIAEIVCADSSTIIRTLEGDKIFGWGRGYSLERNLDISRFKPKELSSIETQHRFLLPALSEAHSLAVEPQSQTTTEEKPSRPSSVLLGNLQVDLPQIPEGDLESGQKESTREFHSQLKQLTEG